MVKKISAIFLALVLCLTAMIIPVSASVELGSAQIAFSLEWDKDYYEAGDTAILSVYMDAEDSLSLATGSFLIGLSSDVFDPAVHTTTDLKATGMIAEWFESYYTPASGGLSQLASTVVPKVQAVNTAEENELYDWYVKYTAGKNSAGGWHESIGTTKDGFHGDEFIADEPIIQIVLTVRDDVADGTVVNAAITSGALTSTPVQTSWKFYKNPGVATTTGTLAATDFDISQAVASVTIGEPDPCAAGHDFSEVEEEAVAPTCTEAGKTALMGCSRCDATEGGAEVAALGHTYEAVVTAPTCTEAGYTTYTCACGDTYVADEVAATGHTAGAPVIENSTDAACGEAGSYEEVIYCTVCTTEISRETKTVDALPHEYEVTASTAPTCTAAGSKTYTCAKCGDTYDEEITATGHTYETVVTAPTCTAAGYTTYTCACGDTYEADEVAATGHSHTAEETTAPTCTEAGVMTYTCACGDTYTEEIAANGHDLTAVEAKAPTCTVAGYEAYEYCSACDYTTIVEIPAPGHDYKENIVKEPTCTTVGRKNEVCSVCGTAKPSSMVEIPTIAHNYEPVVTAPTCEAAGYTTYTCACGDSYVADEVAATGHTYEVTFVKNPTCSKDGYTTYTCACGDSYKETIDSRNHTNEDGSSALVEIPAVPATCKNPGYTAGMVCSICNTQTVVPSLTEKAEHAWDNGVVTEPTYTSQGYTTYTCDNCGETKKDNFVPALEVEYSVSIRQPSITKIRCMDTIVLHTVVEGSDDYTVVWTADNENFTMVELEGGKLEITSAENGFTVFTATVYDAAGNEVGSDTVEMQSKADIWGKIGGFFRNLFGSTLYYNY